jgi:hypothetical protein
MKLTAPWINEDGGYGKAETSLQPAPLGRLCRASKVGNMIRPDCPTPVETGDEEVTTNFMTARSLAQTLSSFF